MPAANRSPMLKTDSGPGTKDVLSINGLAVVQPHIDFDLCLKSNVLLIKRAGYGSFFVLKN
jgi:hypothetical protein